MKFRIFTVYKIEWSLKNRHKIVTENIDFEAQLAENNLLLLAFTFKLVFVINTLVNKNHMQFCLLFYNKNIISMFAVDNGVCPKMILSNFNLAVDNLFDVYCCCETMCENISRFFFNFSDSPWPKLLFDYQLNWHQRHWVFFPNFLSWHFYIK